MNKEQTAILRKVQAHILDNPKRLRMTNWVVKAPAGYIFNEVGRVNWGEPNKQEIPECGTVGCIAGWTVLLNKPEELAQYTTELFSNSTVSLAGFGIEELATDILGISELEAEKLFYVDKWPEIYRQEYLNSGDNQQERANIVSRVIDDFISRYGVEGVEDIENVPA